MTPTKTLQHANPDLYPNAVAIITILLTMRVSTATPERSFSTMRSEDVLTFHDGNRVTRSTYPDLCLQRHTHWCRSRDSWILRQKEQTSSFRISLSFTKISDMFATNVSGHYVVAVFEHSHNWPHFIKYSIISCSIWNPGICQLIKRPDCTRLHLGVLEFSEFSGRACPRTHLACRTLGSPYGC